MYSLHEVLSHFWLFWYTLRQVSTITQLYLGGGGGDNKLVTVLAH